MTNRSRFKKRLYYIFFLLILFFPMAEIAARIAGYKPYKVVPFTIHTEPKNCLIGDSVLGLALNPGSFVVTMNQELVYKTTHLPNGRRSLGRRHPERDKKLFLFGCSFTYGMGVNDTCSFASILQEKQDTYTIDNFAVPGYGSVQSLIQLRKEMKKGNLPDRVILCFSYLHFERNALTPSYRKSLLMGYARSGRTTPKTLKNARFPYYEKGHLKSVSWDNIYNNWPLRESSAAVNFFNSIQDKKVKESIDVQKTTERVILDIHELCLENSIPFTLCFLDENNEIKRLENFCDSVGVSTSRIGWDYKNKELTNMPVDSHPNEKGHRFIATKILPILTEDQ
jgi:hypothetical protein